MFQVVAPEVQWFFRPFITTLFYLWSFLWARVAWFYGTAAYASWIVNGGRIRCIFHDLFQPFWWAIRQTLCKYRIFKGATFCGAEIPSKYEPGHLLRFSIFLGSLTPIMFGIQFAEVDRADRTYSQLFVIFFFVGTSIISAGGHLFLAFRSRPESWRKLVTRCTGWLVFMPVLVGMWYHYTGLPLIPWYWLTY